MGVNSSTGRERWATKTVRGTRRFATATLAEFVEDAGYARLRSGTVADLLDRWMGQASSAWSSTTVVQTRSVVEHHLKPQLGHVPVNKLTTIDIDAMYLHLLRGSGRDGSPLAPGTMHRPHVVLHRALTQAVRWEWIWLNPAANASPPRVAPAEIRPPTPDQLQRLVASVEASDPDFATYLWLAASTGARRSQMLGLRWADIDFSHSAIGLSRAYVDGPVGPVLRATKTHRTYRVAVDAESMLRLVHHYRRALERGSGAVSGQAFVFTVAAQRLGHARASTTLNVYGHCVPGADRDAADYIAGLLAGDADRERTV
ncbi:unannotated protein [freshwater metagenome]|uniref:Unannotated protein n=1 Tax=freshwater metagenome TaxID=449393 RepID=A0A6J7ENF6_9ZZZZ